LSVGRSGQKRFARPPVITRNRIPTLVTRKVGTKESRSVSKPEIETTGSTVVYRNRWMTVREDAILRSNGTAGIYGVVEKPDFAVIAAVKDQSIYLVEQYRYPVGARFWELPQGSWEDRVIDPLGLAKAELREETGLVAGSMLHVGRLFLAYGHSDQAYDLYLATDLREGEAQLDAEEEGLVSRAFPVQVFQTMIEDGTIKDATTVAAFGLLRLKGLL
jgi:ADP-ribose pyrophosphatase